MSRSYKETLINRYIVNGGVGVGDRTVAEKLSGADLLYLVAASEAAAPVIAATPSSISGATYDLGIVADADIVADSAEQLSGADMAWEIGN